MPPPLAPTSCNVYTPANVAEAMAKAIGDIPDARWLDPCVGGGAFPRALSSIGVDLRRVTTLDVNVVDPDLSYILTHHTRADFVKWASATSETFDRFIANPPYISLNRLPIRLRRPALRVPQPDGRAVTLRSNYWYAFVCAGLQLLAKGAGVSLLLPAAFDHADYAAPLRVQLSSLFDTVEIHRCHRPLFPAVQDGCVVVVARGYGYGCGRAPERREYETLDGLVRGLGGGAPSRVRIEDRTVPDDLQKVCRLGDIVQFRIGGVTGDSKYFLLNEEDRLEGALPTHALRPVLSKSRHLNAATIGQKEWQALRDAGERVWLFDPPPSALRHAAVQRYIAKPEKAGGCKRGRYKIRCRDPWYRTPLPSRFDGYISGMTTVGPWIALQGWSRIAATNTLYTVSFRSAFTPGERAAWALALLSSVARQSAAEIGRRYADGLLKFEPSDLSKIKVPVPRSRRRAKGAYNKAVAALLAGNPEASAAIADEWLKQSLVTSLS